MHPLRLSLFALLLLAVLGLSQEAEAGLVEIRLNDTDLTITEEDEETDYRMVIAGVGGLIAVSIIGAGIIIRRD